MADRPASGSVRRQSPLAERAACGCQEGAIGASACAGFAAMAYWLTAESLDLSMILWIVAGFVTGGSIGKLFGLRRERLRSAPGRFGERG